MTNNTAVPQKIKNRTSRLSSNFTSGWKTELKAGTQKY